jgi:osmoprotectant transport system permease protein
MASFTLASSASSAQSADKPLPRATRLRSLLVGFLLLACPAFAQAQTAESKPPVIHVGSKSFTESVVLGEMLAQLAAHAGAKAEHEAELGGTQIAFAALTKGDIDAYCEYTGTLSLEVLEDSHPRTTADIEKLLAARGLKITRSLGFNNAYAVGMRRDLAERLKLKSISDITRRQHEPQIARLKFGFSDEFMNRGDGWPGLAARYRLNFQPAGLDHNLAYRGIRAGTVDVTDVYTTDAEVAAYDLTTLEDDRGYFPPYECVILYRADLESRAPQVLAAWKRLEGAINDDTILEMNSRARLDRVLEGRVSAEFLGRELGIDVPIPDDNRFQRMLVQLGINTRQHLLLVLVSLSAAMVIALPLGIIAYRRPRAGQPILGAVGILQTLPSMAVLMFLIPLLGLGVWPTVTALFLYSLLPIVRNTYAGLQQIPESLRESATVLGLTPRARLWLVELPMASRSILAGIKTAAVINVGTATIGGLIGAGGYGQPIITGTRLNDLSIILQGAIPAAVMALAVQGLFELAERFVVPKGLRLKPAG